MPWWLVYHYNLVFVSKENTVVDCSTTPPLANSDHYGLQVQCDWRHSGKQVRVFPTQIWCFKDADFEMTCNIDVSAANWHYQFMEIMEACIPCKALKHRKNLPWLSRDITRVMRKRTAAFRASKTSASPGVFLKYKHLHNKVVKLLKSAKVHYFRNLDPSNKKSFRRVVKYLNKKQSSLPVLCHNGKAVSSDQEMATILNEFFSTCFNTLLPPLLPLNNVPVLLNQCPEDLLCTVDEISSLLKSLDVSKANGRDGISARMLKFTSHAIAPSLKRLFNISIRLGRFRTCWKASLVVLVPKSSKHQEASNYRPIPYCLC